MFANLAGAAIALGFFGVEMLVGVMNEALDALAISAINGNSDAGRKRGQFRILRHDGVNALHDAVGFFLFGFRQYQGKFIAAIARGGINGAAVDAQSICHTTDRAAADEMAVRVVYLLQAIKIEEQQREGTASTVGALRFVFQNVKKAAVIREARKGIADGEMPNLLEEPRVIKERTSEGDSIANDAEALRKNERGVQETSGLRGCELGGEVEPGCGIDGTVEGGIIVCQTPAIPDERNEKEDCRKKLLRAGNESQLVGRHFRGQLAHGNCDEVCQKHDGEESARDFTLCVAGPRDEFFNNQRNHEKQRENQPAEPEGYRRPLEFENRLGSDVEEQKAGRHQDSAGKQEAGTEDEGNAVLRTLEPNEGHSREDKRQKARDNLQIALQGGVGVQRNRANPKSEQQNGKEGDNVPKGRSGTYVARFDRGFAHNHFLAGGGSISIRPLNPAKGFS